MIRQLLNLITIVDGIRNQLFPQLKKQIEDYKPDDNNNNPADFHVIVLTVNEFNSTLRSALQDLFHLKFVSREKSKFNAGANADIGQEYTDQWRKIESFFNHQTTSDSLSLTALQKQLDLLNEQTKQLACGLKSTDRTLDEFQQLLNLIKRLITENADIELQSDIQQQSQDMQLELSEVINPIKTANNNTLRHTRTTSINTEYADEKRFELGSDSALENPADSKDLSSEIKINPQPQKQMASRKVEVSIAKFALLQKLRGHQSIDQLIEDLIFNNAYKLQEEVMDPLNPRMKIMEVKEFDLKELYERLIKERETGIGSYLRDSRTYPKVRIAYELANLDPNSSEKHPAHVVERALAAPRPELEHSPAKDRLFRHALRAAHPDLTHAQKGRALIDLAKSYREEKALDKAHLYLNRAIRGAFFTGDSIELFNARKEMVSLCRDLFFSGKPEWQETAKSWINANTKPLELNDAFLARLEFLSLSDNRNDHLQFVNMFLTAGGCTLLFLPDNLKRLENIKLNPNTKHQISLYAHMFTLAIDFATANNTHDPSTLALLEKLKNNPQDPARVKKLANYFCSFIPGVVNPVPNAAKLLYLSLCNHQTAGQEAQYYLAWLTQAEGNEPKSLGRSASGGAKDSEDRFAIYDTIYNLQEAYLDWALLSIKDDISPTGMQKSNTPWPSSYIQLKTLLYELQNMAELVGLSFNGDNARIVELMGELKLTPALNGDPRRKLFSPLLFKLARFLRGMPQLESIGKGFEGRDDHQQASAKQLDKLRQDGTLKKLHTFLSALYAGWEKHDYSKPNDAIFIQLAQIHADYIHYCQENTIHAVIACLLNAVSDKNKIPTELQLIAARIYLDGFHLLGVYLIKPDTATALTFLKNCFAHGTAEIASKAAELLQLINCYPEKYGEIPDQLVIEKLDSYLGKDQPNAAIQKELEKIWSQPPCEPDKLQDIINGGNPATDRYYERGLVQIVRYLAEREKSLFKESNRAKLNPNSITPEFLDHINLSYVAIANLRQKLGEGAWPQIPRTTKNPPDTWKIITLVLPSKIKHLKFFKDLTEKMPQNELERVINTYAQKIVQTCEQVDTLEIYLNQLCKKCDIGDAPAVPAKTKENTIAVKSLAASNKSSLTTTKHKNYGTAKPASDATQHLLLDIQDELDEKQNINLNRDEKEPLEEDRNSLGAYIPRQVAFNKKSFLKKLQNTRFGPGLATIAIGAGLVATAIPVISAFAADENTQAKKQEYMDSLNIPAACAPWAETDPNYPGICILSDTLLANPLIDAILTIRALTDSIIGSFVSILIIPLVLVLLYALLRKPVRPLYDILPTIIVWDGLRIQSQQVTVQQTITAPVQNAPLTDPRYINVFPQYNNRNRGDRKIVTNVAKDDEKFEERNKLPAFVPPTTAQEWYEKLNQLAANQECGLILGAKYATHLGMQQALISIFGDKVHIIHPDFNMNESLLHKDQQFSAGVKYCLAINEKLKEDKNKPIIIVLNTKPGISESKLPHWTTCVILPANYTTPLGIKLNNAVPKIFFINSLRPGNTLPTIFQEMLQSETRFIQETQKNNHTTQQKLKIPALFSNAEFVKNSKDLQPQQPDNEHTGQCDWGGWVVYNAIMLVLTGDNKFLEQFKGQPVIENGYKLRWFFPKLSEPGPLVAAANPEAEIVRYLPPATAKTPTATLLSKTHTLTHPLNNPPSPRTPSAASDAITPAVVASNRK